MKRLLSLALVALLFMAFAASGSEPVVGMQATTATEALSTTEASTVQRDEDGVGFYEQTRSPWPPPILASHDFPAVYVTVRVKFQYGGQDWMIQLWKGRYGLVMLGGEIAVLKKPVEQPAEHYWPIEPSEELAISMDVYQHNFVTGKTKHLFTRSTDAAWWFNGFVAGSFMEYNRKDEIVMVGTIAFPDPEMLKAFEESFAKIGFKSGTTDHEHPETYAIDGNALTFSWQYIDQDA